MPTYTIDTTAQQVATDLASNITGKTVLITGVSPNSLGASAAQTIASKSPSLLILAGRSPSKVAEVQSTLLKDQPNLNTKILIVDFTSFKSVRKAADETLSYTSTTGIDAILNVAGVMAVPEFTKTEDGIEMSWQVNYFAPFLLTNLLMERVVKVGGAVVNITSDGHMRADSLNLDVNYEDGKAYNKWAAYGHSKAAMILFSIALAKRLGGKIRAFSVDPGVVLTTALTRSIPQSEYKALGWVDENGNLNTAAFTPVSPSQAVSGMIMAAFDKSIAGQNGSVIGESRVDNEKFAAPYARDSNMANKLWTVSETLVGQSFNY